MKGGIIGRVDGHFEVVDDVTETVQKDDHELARRLEIQRVFSLPSGQMAFEGHAAKERLRPQETTEIIDGRIQVQKEPRVVTQRAEFVGVPGEYVLVDSSGGSFAFDLIARDTNTDIERSSIDLDAFVERARDVEPWKVGFAGYSGNAENGLIHGTDLLNDRNFGEVISNAAINQLGVEHTYRNQTVKMTATQSGYVEIYQPSDFGSADYLEYFLDEIAPHVA